MKYSIDSRTIEPGDIFIPVKGPRFDGRDFIDDVIAKGGRVLDVNLFDYAKKYRQKLGCTVIGITGSAGKTTIKELAYSVLKHRYKVEKTFENQNNEYGVPLTLLSADMSTEILIVEMGMRKKKDLTFLTKMVQPDIIVFSGVGKTHIEFFSNQRQLALAKAEIFRKSNQWQSRKVRHAFINQNGAYHSLIVEKADKAGYNIHVYEGNDKLAENINVCYQIGYFFGIENALIQDGIQAFKPSAASNEKI